MQIVRFAMNRHGRDVTLTIPECWTDWTYEGIAFARHPNGFDVVAQDDEQYWLLPLAPYYEIPLASAEDSAYKGNG